MEIAWSRQKRWFFALKPASFPKLLVPMTFGQLLGIVAAGSIDSVAVSLLVAFTLADGVFIVLGNDFADRRVDALKRTMFPDAGSPKTIPDGILSAEQVFRGALWGGTVAFVVVAAAAAALGRPLLLVLGAVCLSLFAAYSFPPLSVNYRGGGEFLEAVGVGGALPLLCLHAHTGSLWPPGVELLPGLVALSLASAVASGLSDEESDRVGGKRTIVTSFGNARARWLSEACLLAGAGLWLSALAFDRVSAVAVFAGSAVVVVRWVRARRLSDGARTRAFRAQRLYKSELHRAIWDGAATVAVLSVASELLR